MRYDAFVSYSHAADGELAPALQRGLQCLARPWHRRRALEVFRDHTGLSVSPALWSSIKSALDGSEYFVLLASPDAAASQWVNQEIEYWLARHPVDRLLPVLTAGDMVWDAERGDFDPDRSTAVPAALYGVFGEEPRHLDLRWARAETELDLRHGKFRDAVAELAAGMHGMSKEDLDSEDVARHRRMLRLRRGVFAGVAALLVLLAGVGVVAVRNARDAADAATAALHALQLAERERGVARTAGAEARRQQSLAETEQQRAQRAGAEARRQTSIATAEQARAQRAAAESRRQQTIADQQQARADRAAAAAEQHRAAASEEQRKAKQAKAEADRQRAKADEERRRAEAAAAEAEHQAARAAEEQRKAQEAAAEALRQRRVSVGRRLLADADTARDGDPDTAMKLGIAAASMFPGTETKAGLANVLTATHYAGTLTDDTGPAKFICLSADGRAAATARPDGSIQVWDLTDAAAPRKLARITGEATTVADIALSADGHTLAYAADEAVQLWNLADGRADKFAADITVHARSVTGLALSADGRTLLTSGWDNPSSWDSSTRLWDLSTRRNARPRAHLSVYTDAVTTAAFSPDGRMLVIGGAPVRVWDLSEPAPRLRSELTGASGTVTLSADARTLASSSEDATVLWDLTPTDPTRLAVVGSDALSAVEFSADGRTLAALDSWDNTVHVWDLAERARPREIAHVTSHLGFGYVKGFSLGANSFLTANFSGEVRIWDLTDRTRPDRSAYLTLHPGTAVKAATLSADGHTLATGDDDKIVRVWDVADRTHPTQLAELTGHAPMDIVALSRDGTTLATASSNDAVVVWDLSDRRQPRKIAEFNGPPGTGGLVRAVALTTNGNTLAIGREDGTLALWDLTGDTPKALARLTGVQDVNAMAFSADGTALAAAANSDIVVWDVTDRTHLRQRARVTASNSSLDTLALSADGHIVAAGGYDRPVTVWDLTDPKHPRRLAYLTDHVDHVDSVALSADGRTMATGSDDKTVILWDLTDRTHVRRLAQLRTNIYRLAAVTLSADGRTLVTAGWDGSIQVWDLTNVNQLRDKPVERACEITGGFDRDEWARYVGDLPYEQTCP